MDLPIVVVTVVAIGMGIATFAGVSIFWIRFRKNHPGGGFDPAAMKSKVEATVMLAVALCASALVFYGLLVLLG